MSGTRDHGWSAAPSRRGAALALARDERGAIMVLGIFMCTTLVGALWYIAGIGDAIVYRERLQEGADAIAFSAAALHARGMNLLVLINLIMACVLAVRVILKVIQVALVFAAVVFYGLSLIPFNPLGVFFGGLAVLTQEGAQLEQQIITNTREPINNTLKALSAAAAGIAKAVPPASIGGAMLVRERYRPFINSGFAWPKELTAGLPVTEGTTDRLCEEAGEAAGSLLDEALPKSIQLGAGKGIFGGLVGKIAKAGAGYFCELGTTSGPPDFGEMARETANERCDSEEKKKQHDHEEASKAWHAECNRDGVRCVDAVIEVRQVFLGIPGPEMTGLERLRASKKAEDQEKLARLEDLQGKRDAAYGAMIGFDKGACSDEQTKGIADELKKKVPPSQAGTSQGKTPKKVLDDWMNGTNNAQILAYVTADDDGPWLNRSPKGVRIGAMKDKRAGDIGKPDGSNFAYAQAEFFYDCSGPWLSEDCNGEPDSDKEEAMWHLHWRARLRRYNDPFPGFAGNLLDFKLDSYITENLVNMQKAIAANRSFHSIGNLNMLAKLEALNLQALRFKFETYKLH
jgi:hypothetical protein